VACGARSDLTTADAGSHEDGAVTPLADAGPDAASKCDHSSPGALRIGRFDNGDAEPSALAVAGPTLFVGVRQLEEIDRIATAGGSLQRLAISDYLAGPIVTDGAHLAYPVFTPDASATLSIGSYDIASGALTQLANPPFGEGSTNYVTDVAAPEPGALGAYWLLTHLASAGGAYASMLVRWDGARIAPVTTIAEYTWELHIGEHFAALRSSSGLRAVSLDTGSTTSFGAGAAVDASLFAVKHDAAFFTNDAKSIERVDLATMASTTLLTGISVVPCGFCTEPVAWADDAWLYFVDWDPAGPNVRILRVRLEGGAPETVWAGGDAAVFALTGDDCTLYWTMSGANGSAPVVMRMPKP